MVLAKRETRNIRFTLGGLSLGVIFPSRWLCRSRLSTVSYLPDGGYPPRPRRGKYCMWLRNIAAPLIVDTITTTTSQRLVVMPEACRVGSRAQQAAQVLLLAWQIDAALVLLLFSAYLNACCLSRCCATTNNVCLVEDEEGSRRLGDS